MASVFWLLHIRALGRRALATILVVTGIALGTGLLVGVLMLYQAVGEPYSSVTQGIGTKADLQVTPLVPGRLPEAIVHDLRNLADVKAAVPVVGGIRRIASDQADSSLVLLGTDCSVEGLIGQFDCAGIEATLSGSHSSPGQTALVLGQGAASALSVREGDSIGVAGGSRQAAYVADIVNSGPLAELNAGMWAVGLVPDVQDLLGYGPHLDAVYLETTSEAAASQVASVAPSAEVHKPDTANNVLVALLRVTLLFAAVLAILCGGMIAVNSFTISLDERRRTLAITVALGQSPQRLVSSLVLEGALLGALGGLLAIPLSVLLGRYLTSIFGASVLGDSGLDLTAQFSSWSALTSIAAGSIAGALSALFPSIRLIRDGALLAVREQAGILPSHSAPVWPLTLLLLVIPGAMGVWAYGRGYLPFTVGFLALGLAVLGMLVGFFAAVPLAVRALNHVTRPSGATGMLAIADLLRDPFRLAAVVATVGIGVGAAVALVSGRQLVGDAVSRDLQAQVAEDIYLLPRVFGSNTAATFSEEAVGTIRDTEGVTAAWPQRSIVLGTGATGLTVLGGSEERPRGVLARSSTTTDGQDILQAGNMIVSDLVANAENLAVGDELHLPTSGGSAALSVIGVRPSGYAEDNGVGAVVEVSESDAQALWNAPITSVIVQTEPSLSAASLEAQLRSQGLVEVHAYSSSELGTRAKEYIGSYLSPAIAMGLVMVVVSGLAVANFLVLSLIQRRRLRAVLRFVGFSPPVERRTLLYQAVVMGTIGSVFGIVAALITSWLFTLAFPALVATSVEWSVVWWAAGSGAVLSIIICVMATLPSTVEAGNLDMLSALAAD